jgi:hypothetical protein
MRFLRQNLLRPDLHAQLLAQEKTDFKNFAKAVGSSASGCFTARNCKLSYDSFQNRFERLARNGIFLHALLMKQISLDEDLAADGLESYTQSKYFPHNIQILVGAETGFIYDMNLCRFRRKGRMTDKQKEKSARLYAGKSFREKDMDIMFGRLLDTGSRLLERSTRSSITLHTDENPSYLRCIAQHSPLSTNRRFPGGREAFHRNRYFLSHGLSFMTPTWTELWNKTVHSPLHPRPGKTASYIRM